MSKPTIPTADPRRPFPLVFFAPVRVMQTGTGVTANVPGKGQFAWKDTSILDVLQTIAASSEGERMFVRLPVTTPPLRGVQIARRKMDSHYRPLADVVADLEVT